MTSEPEHDDVRLEVRGKHSRKSRIKACEARIASHHQHRLLCGHARWAAAQNLVHTADSALHEAGRFFNSGADWMTTPGMMAEP